MPKESERILSDIEKLRRRLYSLVEVKGLTDPEVKALSKELDKILNEYDRVRESLVSGKDGCDRSKNTRNYNKEE